MNRRLTALFAALEALLVVGVGIGIPLVPLTLLWALQYGLTLDWIVFWRAAVDIWLLGHGVDVRFTLDPLVAASSGFPGAATPFVITIAPLAFALITALLGVRAGRRIGETPHRHLGRFAGLAVFALLSLGVAFTALSVDARPSLVQSALMPPLLFGVGMFLGALRVRRSLGFGASSGGAALSSSAADSDGGLGSGDGSTLSGRRVSALGVRLRSTSSRVTASIGGARTRASARLDAISDSPMWRAIRSVIAGGAAAAAVVLAISALTVGALLAASYAQVISLYEAVQAGILGGVALTVGQLAFIPNLVIWAASWFTGPGFALGTGSSVSPLGTDLGPLPAVPFLGALPAGALSFAYVGLLVPVLAGFLAAAVMRPRLIREGVDRALPLAASGLAMGLVGGVVLGALAWISSGAAGPGRLVEVGPSWLLVGCWGALEIGLAAAISLVVAVVAPGTPDLVRRGAERMRRADGAAASDAGSDTGANPGSASGGG